MSLSWAGQRRAFIYDRNALNLNEFVLNPNHCPLHFTFFLSWHFSEQQQQLRTFYSKLKITRENPTSRNEAAKRVAFDTLHEANSS